MGTSQQRIGIKMAKIEKCKMPPESFQKLIDYYGKEAFNPIISSAPIEAADIISLKKLCQPPKTIKVNETYVMNKATLLGLLSNKSDISIQFEYTVKCDKEPTRGQLKVIDKFVLGPTTYIYECTICSSMKNNEIMIMKETTAKHIEECKRLSGCHSAPRPIKS